MIVKAHYQSLCDRTGPEQPLPALRIIWALDRKALALTHTERQRVGKSALLSDSEGSAAREYS